MTNDSDKLDQARAVFLAALMVVSVFGGTIAFAGTAAAASGPVKNVDTGETFSDIQTAIDDANTTDGHTIVVGSGSYSENVVVDKSVTVRSENGSSATTVTASSGVVFEVTAPGVTIDGFTVDVPNESSDSSAKGIHVKADDVVIENNAITGLRTGEGVNSNNGYNGVRTNGDNITVQNNDVSNFYLGIYAPSSNTTVVSNTISNVTTGVATYSTSDDFVAAENTITGAEIQGIALFKLDGAEVTNNSISLNSTGVDTGSFSPKAIDGNEASNATVRGNTITTANGSPGISFTAIPSPAENTFVVENNDVSTSGTDLFFGSQPGSLNGESTANARIASAYETNALVNVTIGTETRTDAPGAPEVTDLELFDRDQDGDIDAVTVTVDENVSDATLDAGDFTIAGHTVDNVSTLNGAYDDTFQLLLDDDNEVDGTGGADTEYKVALAGSVTDLAGNELQAIDQQNVTYTDSAKPVVETVSFTPSVVNLGNNPTTVTVSVTFSENVNSAPTTFTLDGVGMTGVTAENATVTGTTDSDLGNSFVDHFVNTTVEGATDADSNTQVAFDQANFQVDTIGPKIDTNTVTTKDADNDGTVDQLVVTLNDNVDDSTVEVSDFAVSNPSATIDSVGTGDTANDNVVVLHVTGLPAEDTSVTPDVTLYQGSIKDDAGNFGPAADQTKTAEDGAKPIVLSLSVNETTLNESDVPADVQVNATFSENMSTDPTVTLVGLQSDIGVSTGSDGDASVSGITSSQITDNDEDATVYVNVTGGADASANANAVETFNESRLTVDTLAPSVTANGTTVPTDIVNGTLDLTSYFDIAEDDGGETTYLINATGGSNYTAVENPSAWDSSQIEDTNSLVVKAVDTDDVGNSDNATTSQISIDNTAPQITINEPTEMSAEQTGSTLTVQADVVEPNVDGNATVVLYGDNNTIQYNVSVSDLENGVDLRLNTSENATASGARLPNLNETNGTFETGVIYDIDVTVTDATNKSTTETKTDVLFLDNTAPDELAIVAPGDDPEDAMEYESGDGLQIAYGYSEDNVESVTVELTDSNGDVVETWNVDESQYTDSSVVKSFEVQLPTGLDDGRYNVSVTVTDAAGNEINGSTTNGTVAINNVDKSAGNPQFNAPADATATINDSGEVTIDVTYNVSVPSVEDAGDIDQEQDSLDSVSIEADDVGTLTVEYWDDSAGVYKTYTESVGVEEVAAANATANADVMATVTFNVSDAGPMLEDGDRVLDRSLALDGDSVTVIATDSSGDTTNSSDHVIGSTTFESQSEVEPEIESVEVDGPDHASDTLVVTFTRPVKIIDDVNISDFAYQDVNGDGANYVTDGYVSEVASTTVYLQLNEPVTAGDVGSDILDIQPDVFQNAREGTIMGADSGTIMETTAPSIDGDATVGENASTLTVSFDQNVYAADGGNLTAANVSYSDSADVSSVEHTSGSDTVTIVLTGDVTSEEAGSATVSFDAVADRFDNVAEDLSTTVEDYEDPSGLELVEPSERMEKQSGDTLDVTYRYTENVPENTESVTVTLVSADDGTTYSYNVDDSQYVDDATNKSITLDLDSDVEDNLEDGSYHVRVTATDASGNEQMVESESALVVIDDDAPSVTDVSVDPSSDVSPDETVGVSYEYADATNTSNVTVHIVAAEDEGNFTAGDFANATFAQKTVDVDHASGEQSVAVDLSTLAAIEDNSDYVVFVTATDASGHTNLDVEADPIVDQAGADLDVNAAKPTIEAAEANAGSAMVTVEFSEEIVAADGDLSADDFAFQDVGGTNGIQSVEQTGPSTVELTLDSAVSVSDLGNDLVSVREGAVVDTDGENARAVSSDSAVALSDVDDPSADSIDAGPVNADNADQYTVTVDVGSEPVDVELVVSDGESNVTDTKQSVTGVVDFTVDASGLNDTDSLDVSATLTDAGGNSATASTSTVKDTEAPTVVEAYTDVSTNWVYVNVSEQLDNPSAEEFSVSSDAHSVESVTPFASDGDYWVALELNASVPAGAINTSDVVVTSTATDLAGNAASGQAKLMDEGGPHITETDAERGSANITVTVDEDTVAADGSLNTSDFVYTDTNGEGAANITAVERLGPRTFRVQVDSALTPSDIDEDSIALNDSLVDLVDNPAYTGAHSLDEGQFPRVSTTTEGSNVTVTVETAANLSAEGTSLSLTMEGRHRLVNTEATSLEERFTVELNASDFTEVSSGVYEATVEVPRDGTYDVSGALETDQGINMLYEIADVDTKAPVVSDSVILDVYAGGNTVVGVTFDEPVDASEITADNISIEGYDGDIAGVYAFGEAGMVQVVLESQLQTGTSPNVTIDGSSYTELSNDESAGVEDGSTVVHTDKLHLSEGKNFVSVPAAAGELELSSLDLSNVDVVFRYDAATGSWESYDPDAQENDFTTLEGGVGYIFVMEDSDTLDINVHNLPGSTGEVSAPSSQQLHEGWNLVGHYQENTQQRSVALSSVESTFRVYAQAEGSTTLTYTAVQPEDNFERGEGYWVFVTEDEVYTEAPYIVAD